MTSAGTGLLGALAAGCLAAAAVGGEQLALLVLAAALVTWFGLYETAGLGS